MATPEHCTSFERSAHRYLRAYPRRWRLSKEAEVTAVLADLAGPGATRLDLRSGAGLVVNGFRTRHRERPPLHLLAAYRIFGRRLPPRYRGWVRDDIEGALLGFRQMVWRFSPMIFAWVVVPLVIGHPVAWNLLGPYFLLLATVTAATAARRRRTEAGRHLVPGVDEPFGPSDLARGWILRDRVRARPMLGRLACAAAVVAAIATPMSIGGARWVQPVALAVGAAIAVLAGRRLRRVVPRRREQGARRMVDHGTHWDAAIVLGAALLIGLASLWGQVAVAISASAVALLPVLVVAWREAARTLGELALVDVWTIGATGQVSPVDRVVKGIFAPPMDTGTELAQ
ncbi:hypothetical protein [Cellulomonas sp. URHD0024]|uniref:hypothetical protein n=1 Tax=Cellulomonas sp. URHD0024 TaxID=1302620 RepID=UPI00041B3F02|nr:hypothetical protein [Cellulomonas sp. URHD0024]